MMKSLLILIMVCLTIFTISNLMKKPSTKTQEKITTFECGFDPYHKMRTTFSLRFFLITVLFLIFDVEIAAMLPLPLTNVMASETVFSISNMILFLILMSGLSFEWTQGALSWSWTYI